METIRRVEEIMVGDIIAYVVLALFLVGPTLLILPSLMEIALGWDFSKEQGPQTSGESPDDTSSENQGGA